MKRLVWEFLNTKFEGIQIYRRVWDLVDKRKVEFIAKDAGIVQIIHWDNGQEDGIRVNSFVRRDIRLYFDIHDIDIEMYVLDWCQDKAIEVETSD